MKNYIAILSVMILVVSCTNKKEVTKQTAKTGKQAIANPGVESVELTDEQIKNGGIEIGDPLTQDVYTTLKVNGTVEVPPEKRYTISFPMPGYLTKCNLIPGTYIVKGAPMATLEDAAFIQLQQDYLINKSRLQYSEADFERQQELNTTKANSDKTFQQARADYQSQKVQVSALSEKLKMIGINPAKLTENNISRAVTVYAPISGYVSKINVNTGKYITPTDILFELIDPSELHLSLTVFEKDAQSLQAGQKVVCYTNTRPEQKIMATIHLINHSINDSRSVEVHCDFDQKSNHLLPGTYMTAEIQQDNQHALVLPEDAVVRWQNEYYVFAALSSRKFLMHKVQTGTTANGYTSILTQLPKGNVVLKNAFALLMMIKNRNDEQ